MAIQTTRCILSFFTLAILAACANVSEKTIELPVSTFRRQSDLPQGRVSQTTINGSWRSDCIVDTKKGLIYKIELSFQDNLLLSRTTNYNDAKCTVANSEEERLSQIVLDSSNEDNVLMTETFLSMKMRALSADGTKALNAVEYCGYSSWVKNEYRVFTSATPCGLNQSELYHSEVFGTQELHLNPCGPSTTADCKPLIFIR